MPPEQIFHFSKISRQKNNTTFLGYHYFAPLDLTTSSAPFFFFFALRRKLQEWREAKGISYKRPPMEVKPKVRRTVAVAQPFWAAMKEEDDAHSLICAVDRSLVDCIKLLGEVMFLSHVVFLS